MNDESCELTQSVRYSIRIISFCFIGLIDLVLLYYAYSYLRLSVTTDIKKNAASASGPDPCSVGVPCFYLHEQCIIRLDRLEATLINIKHQ